MKSIFFNQKRSIMNKTKGLLFTASLVLATTFTLSCSSDDGDSGGSSVTYKGQKYKTVKIGEQTWFAENLNYAGDDNSMGKCYNNLDSNCGTYGRLYTWSEARAVCTDGWHLPTKAEFEGMIAYIGGFYTGGKKLKAKNGWEHNGNGTDDYGFSAMPCGGGGSGGFSGVGIEGHWWSASEIKDEDDAYRLFMTYTHEGFNSDYVYQGNYPKSALLSVRCVKD